MCIVRAANLIRHGGLVMARILNRLLDEFYDGNTCYMFMYVPIAILMQIRHKTGVVVISAVGSALLLLRKCARIAINFCSLVLKLNMGHTCSNDLPCRFSRLHVCTEYIGYVVYSFISEPLAADGPSKMDVVLMTARSSVPMINYEATIYTHAEAVYDFIASHEFSLMVRAPADCDTSIIFVVFKRF